MRPAYYCPNCENEQHGDSYEKRKKGRPPLCYCTGVGMEMIPNPDDSHDGITYKEAPDETGTQDSEGRS